jgi:acetylornithine deacetylase
LVASQASTQALKGDPHALVQHPARQPRSVPQGSHAPRSSKALTWIGLANVLAVFGVWAAAAATGGIDFVIQAALLARRRHHVAAVPPDPRPPAVTRGPRIRGPLALLSATGTAGMLRRVTADLTALLSSLVAIDSVNPSLVGIGAGEARIADFIEAWAREAGLDLQRLEETPGRPSVLVRAAGTGGGRTLLLCGHIDTVNVDGMTDPHRPRVEGDRLYGRGAYDMKSGVAAALIAAREAAHLGLAGDVVVAAVADEEHASIGVQEALRHIDADAAVVTEPTELQLAVAHKGFAWTEIEVAGRSAHGSRPHLGVDAIVKMGSVLKELERLDHSLADRGHPLLGRASVHASRIEGGVELSSYPAQCRLALERRTLPGETAAQIETEVEELLDRCRAADSGFLASHRTLLVREPFEIEEDAELVTLVADAAAEVLGAPAKIGGASYWADASFIAAAGIPTVLFGPGGEGAHAIEEWVSLSDTEAVARTLVGVATRLCA